MRTFLGEELLLKNPVLYLLLFKPRRFTKTISSVECAKVVVGLMKFEFPACSPAKDSGWYVPDYSLAQGLSWGRGRGCHFPTRSCKDLMKAAEKVMVCCK